MQLKITSVVAIALAASQAQAALDPKGLAGIVTGLTDTTADVAQTASTISPVNLFTTLPRVITGLKDISGNIAKAETGLNGLTKDDIQQDDQTQICDALTSLVAQAQEAAGAVSGKSGVIGQTPFGAPTGVTLNKVRDSLASFSRSVLGLVPTCGDDVEKKLMTLDSTVDGISLI